jgi:hypothetical protein
MRSAHSLRALGLSAGFACGLLIFCVTSLGALADDISYAEARSAVNSLLRERATIVIQLDAPVSIRYRYYDDLVKTGILDSYAATDSKLGRGAEFRLTARGRALFANRHWLVSNGVVSIHAGDLEVAKILAVHTVSGQSWADYSFVGSLNPTGRSLLEFGPARDWVLENTYPFACKATLADVGRVRTASAEVQRTVLGLRAAYALSWGTPISPNTCDAGEKPGSP